MTKNKTEEMKEDISKYAEIAVIAQTKGGKVLVDTLRQDTANAVETLSNSFKDKSHVELIALCADLKAKLDLYRVLIKAEGNKKEIEELLEEELQ
jgi:hypothetical protein